MGRRLYTRKISLIILILVLCFAAVYLLIKWNICEISDIRVKSLNSCIDVTWKQTFLSDVSIEVYHGDKVVEQAERFLSPSYRFSSGIPGEKYTIHIKDNVNEKTYCFERLLLCDDIIPNLRLISIDTVDGLDPSCETIWAPKIGEDQMDGVSITNNEYKPGVMQIMGGIADRVKIKVRGNTSSALSEKKSYKLDFKKQIGLFSNNGIESREWILLNAGYCLKTYMGNEIARMCSIDLVPEMEFVNLIINGDWKGLYILTQPVSQDTYSKYVTDNGFIIENSAYWWKPDEVYFKTSRQIPQLGYTFKYPKKKRISDRSYGWIRNRIQSIEDELYKTQIDEKTICRYIDLDSFAKCIFVRDLLGQTDGHGSNMYFYITDYLENDIIHMGPLWDFDSAFYCKTDERWSDMHESSGTWTNKLWSSETFSFLYESLTDETMEKFEGKIDAIFEKALLNENEIDDSRQLDAKRWDRQYLIGTQYQSYLEMETAKRGEKYQVTPTVDLKDEIYCYREYLQKRILWMSSMIHDGQ